MKGKHITETLEVRTKEGKVIKRTLSHWYLDDEKRKEIHNWDDPNYEYE